MAVEVACAAVVAVGVVVVAVAVAAVVVVAPCALASARQPPRGGGLLACGVGGVTAWAAV